MGFEFELAGIDLEDCAELIAEIFGGEIAYHHSLQAEVESPGYGTFVVELDARMVQELAEKLEGAKPTRKGLVSWMGDAAEKIVPFEIVTPPLRLGDFDKLEQLRRRLQEMKAQGTKAAFVNAFGMHINPELASEEVDHVRDVLRAFLVLYPWLVKVMDIDFSRRMLTYIDPFPTSYLRLALPADYRPDWGQFITDYLEHNPNRNRALDLLPLFAHIDESSLNSLKESDRKLVKARPSYHYRLPNSEIDCADWTIARDWNRWVEVEKLAGERDKLERMAADYLEFLGKPLRIFSSWPKILDKEHGYRI
ncbi:MAG: amidoligase family protein [Akkermansiaceae bacterium]|nr:amidoligase family protein [Akkermansiaceae bacterium]